MFILRKIKKDVEINQCIGSSYAIISKKNNYEQFIIDYNKFISNNDFIDIDDVFCFIHSNNFIFSGIKDDILIPLFKDSKYYIMNESGKTFSNISYYKN